MTDIEKAIEISRDTMYVAATGKYSYTPSIVENMCLQMAAWKEQQMIEKACEWLKENAYFYVNVYTGSLDENSLIENFRKYMKGNNA